MTEFSGTYELECPDCTVTKKVHRLNSAMKFSRKHEEHTGHSMEWVQMEVDDDELPQIKARHKVVCHNCSSKQLFKSEDAAKEYAREHEAYTDHAPSQPELVTENTFAESDLKELLGELEMESERGASLGTLLAFGSWVGIKETEVMEQLEELMIKGEIYEPSQNHYRTT